jgi:hypothetical protein
MTGLKIKKVFFSVKTNEVHLEVYLILLEVALIYINDLK